MNWKKRKKKDHRRQQARRQASAAGVRSTAAGPSKTLALVKRIAGPQKPASTQAQAVSDPKAILKQRIGTLPTLVEKHTSAAAANVLAMPAELDELSDRLERGASTALPEPRSDITLDVVLGIDFGTSSTKIVARLPYESGKPSFAIPCVRFAMAEGHPHMWESRIWLTPEGLFSLAPERGAAVLCSIKTNLMRPDCDHAMVLHVPGRSATALECATAFLALQIRQARGWLYRNQAHMLGRGPIRWHYNVGLPAAKLDQLKSVKQYQTCLVAAIGLAAKIGSVSLDAVRAEIVAINQPDNRLKDMLASLQPEIAAAVAGFAQSRRRQDGLYAMMDVGAGTLDCCTFALKDDDSGDLCPIFEAAVSLLGMQPLELCQGDEPVLECFREEVAGHLIAVLRPTMTKRHPNSPRWKEGLPVFLVGGGKPSRVHKAEVDKIDRNLRHGGKGGFIFRELPDPDGLEHVAGSDQLHRLAVAVGLSLPASDIPQVQLPTSISDVTLLPQRDYEKNYVGSEMV